MALGQSQIFLSENEGVTVTEYKDTSSCAKMVAEDASGTLAVIAGPAIAKTYNLEVLNDNVGDVKQNFTRFYILSKAIDYEESANKASITLQTKNAPGKLSDVLAIIKDHKLNLTKIQSVPIPSDPNAYSFHLDIEFDDKNIFDKTLNAIEKETISLKVLGKYKRELYKTIETTVNSIYKNLN
jgi:prephenate dehydratase